MLRVELGEEYKRRGIWRYVIKSLWRDGGDAVERLSSQPLLDACRMLKSTGAPLSTPVGLFREGRDQPDLTCTVGWGAERTVREHTHRFRKWNPRPPGTWSNQKD
jgi:hypothetical protein